MADNKSVLTVSIVTPDGEEYTNDKCSMAVIQTGSGDIGIMANHIPIIAALKIGPAQFNYGNDESDVLAVNGGFVEFSNNELTIVADSAELKSEIDIDRATSAKERAQQKIKTASEANDTDTMNRAEVALQRAVNRINVAKR
ncbi:F0F1 ATP synthase subunit epsilon [Fructilactobacillus lindneri]|uniref:ATP synthase epsilon chain n=2 Tax=Fructilactobacillus lindneri TaxID=53444 RepID=A0A0R2JQ02_9LACO|nr:F0F1 ATP synthase subunit epsilon [Fructilactobacillus lindneri]ANZ58367.1 F0F1 ATP synthase subunit epsilon [Fructilactobacillus lindneri]ANZ59689.1 F0F1 ATP synthase subunit epsilon [Fructilactobacillus lindneri]KRN79203.1 ATP synthase subunit epsilon [Fructilactobacillus lindneri DSM 20690 = JCM 11027]POG98528.1 F0F1 ATP synthase subunit epsilon [Fructilactobacillus lindneri]POH03916.1 F0F1 ATP synthase subunit epsilon [Fructilactobacillus lindneri]